METGRTMASSEKSPPPAILASTSLRLSPWLTHPGSAGTLATLPSGYTVHDWGNGVIGNRSARPGAYATTGAQLVHGVVSTMSVVDLSSSW